MLVVLLSAFLVVLTTGQQADFSVFQAANQGKVDRSSLITCWGKGASAVQVIDNNPEMGHKCVLKVPEWAENSKQAKELCESKFPYYVIDATADPNKDGTYCTIQINLACDDGYWQIRGKCYKVPTTRYTWTEAQKICAQKPQEGTKPQIAEYYSKAMSLYFDELEKVYDAWVIVPEVKDYFDNMGEGEVPGSVYVQDGAYKYDVKKGSIIMDDLNAKHQVICEYTPPMTKAEMFYIAGIYSEIYPIELYNGGAVIPTANFMTIQQTDFIEATRIWKFNTKHFEPVCMGIGKILNVESFPMTAIEHEFNDIKDRLKHQNFFLTSAVKDDGCKKGDFRQKQQGTGGAKDFQLYSGKENIPGYCDAHSFCFHKKGRYPTLAGMRAQLLCTLHSFNWEFDKCDEGPEWSEPVVSFERTDGRVFCHYINNKKPYLHAEAIAKCEEFNAALSGFDSKAEFDKVRKSIKPQYLSNHVTTPATGNVLECKYWSTKKDEDWRVDDHYWMGGESPCENACDYNGGKHVASWNSGVAVNTEFLNLHSHDGHEWKELPNKERQIVSFRADKSAFHVHKIGEIYTRMFYVCGKSANLKRVEDKKPNVLQQSG